MTDNDIDPIGVSRRRVLGGLGTIGVTSAGAGLGTTAFFSDSESFENNTLTAGELDLYVHFNYDEDQGSFAQWSTPPGTYVQGGVIGQGVSDPETGISLEEGESISVRVEDLKPGDSGTGGFCFSIVDNPAYMWMCGGLTANDQNGFTDPELDVLNPDGDATSDPDGEGQLADAIQLSASYCPRNGTPGEVIVSGSLRDVMAALRAGIPLYGDGDPTQPIANRQPFEGVETPFTDAFFGMEVPNIASTCVCFEWSVPEDVGNEIQTDSVAFDFEFYAEQERHNDGTTNPCVPGVKTTLDGDDAAARGFGASSADGRTGGGAWQSAGSEKETLYAGPDFVDFESLPSFTVGELDEVSYWTKKSGGPGDVDFYLLVYTEPTGSGDDASWYGRRLNAEPYYLTLAGDQADAPANEWNEWTTDGTTDTAPLRFVDANRTGIGLGYGDGTMPTLQDLQAGPTDWSSLRTGGEATSIDYGSLTVKTIALSTGSAWATGFDGSLDDATVRLTGGSELRIDLEP